MINRARRVLLVAWNDVLRVAKDRQTLMWMLAMPVAFMWFFGQTSSGAGGDPRISLAIDDRDGGWLAQAVLDELDGDQLAVFQVDVPSEPSTAPTPPATAVDNSAAPPTPPTPRRRTLVIPEGTTAGALSGDPKTLRLELEEDADFSASTGAEIHVQRGLLRVQARLLEMDIEGVPAAERAARYAELSARDARVELAVSTAGSGQAVPQGYAQSIPGILTMTVLMMTLIYGAVFLVLEREKGLLRRQASLPVSRGELIVGKIAGRLAIAALQITALLLIGRYAFGLALGNSPAGLLLLVSSFALAVAGLATLLGAVLRTTEQASMVGWIGSMVLAGLGGCWWPAELMPGWLQAAAHAFPTAWAMDGFHALISFGRGVEAVLVPSAVLTGFGVLFAGLAARWLRFE